jgi:hypothetical protein
MGKRKKTIEATDPPSQIRKYGHVLFHMKPGQTSPQAAAILYANQQKHEIVFKLEELRKCPKYVVHMFGSTKNIRTLYELLKSIPREKRSLYSVNQSDSKKDVYSILHYDVEWNSHGDSPCPESQKRIDTLIESVKRALQKVGVNTNIEVEIEPLSRPHDTKKGIYKNSFHIFFTNVYFENNTILCMRAFVEHIMDVPPELKFERHTELYMLNEKPSEKNKTTPHVIVDGSIYSKNRCFRLTGSHKANSKQRLSIPDYTTFYNRMTVGKNPPPDAVKVTIKMVQDVILTLSLPIKKKYMSNSKRRVKVNNPNTLKSNNVVCERIQELLEAHGDCETMVYVHDGGYTGRNSSKGRKCLISGRVHQNNNCYFSIMSGGEVWYHCFSQNSHKQYAGLCIGNLKRQLPHEADDKIIDHLKEVRREDLMKELVKDVPGNWIGVNATPHSNGPDDFLVNGYCDVCAKGRVEYLYDRRWGYCVCEPEKYPIPGILLRHVKKVPSFVTADNIVYCLNSELQQDELMAYEKIIASEDPNTMDFKDLNVRYKTRISVLGKPRTRRFDENNLLSWTECPVSSNVSLYTLEANNKHSSERVPTQCIIMNRENKCLIEEYINRDKDINTFPSTSRPILIALLWQEVWWKPLRDHIASVLEVPKAHPFYQASLRYVTDSHVSFVVSSHRKCLVTDNTHTVLDKKSYGYIFMNSSQQWTWVYTCGSLLCEGSVTRTIPYMFTNTIVDVPRPQLIKPEILYRNSPAIVKYMSQNKKKRNCSRKTLTKTVKRQKRIGRRYK